MTLKAALALPRADALALADRLERRFGEKGGVVAVVETTAPDWAVEVYFEAGEPHEIAALLRAESGDVPWSVTRLADRDWVAEGLRHLRPVAAGRFVVHGSHDRIRIPKGRVAVEIDAGQAFGTGHHGTTAGCLHVLDRLTAARSFFHPLDLGTGSGVLAIALAKRLRRPVLATDIDPVAVGVARRNARLNAVHPLVRIVAADGLAHPEVRGGAPFDLIVANILAEPLVRLAPDLARTLADDGVLVLSGLLPRQRERVVAAYGIQGVRLVAAHRFDGWAVLVLDRRQR